MKIGKKDFEYGHRLASGLLPEGEHRSLQELISEWLYDGIYFDFEGDSEYLGCFIENETWEAPDQDLVLEWLESQNENPEFRMAKFERDGKLSVAEREAFKSHVIEDAVGNGDYPSVFVGALQYGKKQLFVYTTRHGHSFEGIEIDILGLFENQEQALLKLFQNGELHL